MSDPAGTAAARAMVSFRQRIDALFADPQAAGLGADLRPPPPAPSPTAADALNSRLAQTLARLGTPIAGDSLRLRKSLTMHDGHIVAMTGDSSALEPDENVRVVTTTTTVLDNSRMRTETTVLVFDVEPGTGS
jgi:hypothetical protein